MRTRSPLRLIRATLVAFALIALVWLALTRARPAQAAGEVQDCSFNGLATALNSGNGLITFNCNGTNAPATISVTQLGGLNVDNGSFWTIDGGDVITLTGLDTYRLFNVRSGGGLTLANILLVHGYAGAGQLSPGHGGALLNAGGRLVLDHATVSDSQSTNGGGGIENAGGTTLLMNGSLLSRNTSQYGGGIDSTGGTLTLLRTTVFGNQALGADGGGGLWLQGTTIVSDSLIFTNFALDSGRGGGIFNLNTLSVTNSTVLGNAADWGGGIQNYLGTTALLSVSLSSNSAITSGAGLMNDQGVVTLTDSTLSGNQATGDEGRGGGIYNLTGTLTLANATLSGNSARKNGGGLYSLNGTATVNNSTLLGNQAASLGGGVFSSHGDITLTHTILNRNSATDGGGGIYHIVGAATVNNSIFSGNSAAQGGGLWISGNGTTALVNNSTFNANQANGGTGGGIVNDGSLVLVNSTLSANAAAQGGGLYNGSTATLTNATLDGNAATMGGGGIYHHGAVVSQIIVLKNTMVANSLSGGNCYAANSVTPLTSSGNNLSSDDSCNAYFTQGTDWNTANPNLGPLTNNGGFTPTQIPFPLPSPGNRAIDGGNGCPVTDQRGVSRPQGAACDIGAVEYVPGEKSPWLWLPLVAR